MSYLLRCLAGCSLLTLWGLTMQAQAQHDTPSFPLYGEADLGLFISSEAGVQTSWHIGTGYRINAVWGVGPEYRSLHWFGDNENRRMHAAGLVVRYTQPRWLARAGLGKVLQGTYVTDADAYKLDYQGNSGYYLTTLLGYRLPYGVTLGMQYVYSGNMVFTQWERDAWEGGAEPIGRIRQHSGMVLFTAGISLP